MQARGAGIGDIFQSTVTMMIPYFQRSYVWKEEQWERYTKDMLSVVFSNSPYFLGAIILKEVKGQNKVFTVIDGQQRLTTTMLFMKALHLKTGRQNKFECVYMQDEDVNKPVLIHNKHDRSAFEEIMRLDAWNISLNSKGRVVDAFKYFKNFVNNLTSTTPEKLLSAVNSYIQFVLIDLTESDDEQQIFDTINSLGVSLTTGDLLKNYFFDQNNESVYSSLWAPVFESVINPYFTEDDDLTKGRLKDSLVEHFFYAFLQIRMWSIPNLPSDYRISFRKQDKLFFSYKTMVEKLGVNRNDLIKEIVDYASIYRDNFDKKVLDHSVPVEASLTRLNLIMNASNSRTMTPYLLYILKNVSDDTERAKIYGYLESYIMRRMICRCKNNNYSDFFSENMINSQINTYSKLKAYVDAKASNDSLAMPSDNDVENAIHQNDLSKEAPVILYLLETRAAHPSGVGVFDDEFNAFISDQLMPIKRNSGQWPLITGYTIDERETLVRTLGNNVLLKSEKKLPSKVKNDSWTAKRIKISSMATGLKLSNDAVASPSWDETDIVKRNDNLAQIANIVWQA